MKQNQKFRSTFESILAQDLITKGIDFDYEPKDGKIKYVIPAKQSTYTPDFILKTKSGKTIIVEAKGIWVYEDRYKHLLIKKSRPDLDIRFVFYNQNNKIRKNSKTTYADICNGKGRGHFKGVTWKYAHKNIPQEWLDE